MEQVVAKDASSEPIETIAPFMAIIGVDTTFVAVSQLLSTRMPNASTEVTSKCFLELFRMGGTIKVDRYSGS
jgi:hypothetical protein